MTDRPTPRALADERDVWSFAVAEDVAELSGVTTVPGDEVGQE